MTADERVRLFWERAAHRVLAGGQFAHLPEEVRRQTAEGVGRAGPARSARAATRPVAGATSNVAPPRRPLPCVHLDDVRIVEECVCPDPWTRRQKNTHECLCECARGHGQRGIVSRLRDCAACDHYAARDPFTDPPDAARPFGWWDDGDVSRIVAEGADALLADPRPSVTRAGRGAVICGGGKYWPSVYVTTRMLREVGRWEGPIQIWYFGGRGEFDGWHQDRMDELSLPGGRVECIDADGMSVVFPARILNGFEVKSYAAWWSGFAEVLLLDADSYPVAPVGPLFDSQPYRERGALFWPDGKWMAADLKWERFRCPPDGGPPWETGQYLVDLARHADVWGLVRYYDDRSDVTYKWCHGDVGTTRAAFARAGRRAGMFAAEPGWVGHSFVQAGPAGPQFVHRCRNKITLKPTAFYTPQSFGTFTPVYDLPHEARVAGLVAELARRHAAR